MLVVMANGISPAIYELSKFMQFYDYIQGLIPRRLRGFVAEHLPSARFQRVRKLVMTMHQSSVNIYKEKLEVLERGAGLKEQLWEGKDLMSILRAYIVRSHPTIRVLRQRPGVFHISEGKHGCIRR